MLFAIGGNVDWQSDNPRILRRLFGASGHHDPAVFVVTTATEFRDDTLMHYKEVFATLGIREGRLAVEHVLRRDADNPALADRVMDADIVFFSGGDQAQLVNELRETRFMEALIRRRGEGRIIAGTSAGAAAMSRKMIYPDGNGGACLKDGFNFCSGMIIDTHFLQRSRTNRLYQMVTQHPDQIGLGLDENTVAIIAPDGTLDILGDNKVTVIDGWKIEAGLPQAKAIMTLSDGDRYDLKKRIVISP